MLGEISHKDLESQRHSRFFFEVIADPAFPMRFLSDWLPSSKDGNGSHRLERAIIFQRLDGGELDGPLKLALWRI